VLNMRRREAAESTMCVEPSRRTRGEEDTPTAHDSVRRAPGVAETR
jgi:hypothetical protein